MKRIQFIRSHFFAGLMVLTPLAVIGWILMSALSILWGCYKLFPDSWQPDGLIADQLVSPFVATLISIAISISLAFVLTIGVALLGWASKQFIGKKALEFLGVVIQKIPVIRSVYSSLDQLLRTLAVGGGQQFSRVVYIEYPRKGIWALAFVTGPAQGPAVPSRHLNVYVPTTPNPTSGFHLIIPEADVRESHLKVEDA
ncbi:MAG: DUF502 domain-containing protein, partial [Bdellovibrionia bacterium]